MLTYIYIYTGCTSDIGITIPRNVSIAMGEMRNSYKMSLGKREGEGAFMRPIVTDAIVIKILRC
jgi:hypothetical protein